MIDPYDVMKAIVVLAIEKTLFDIGKPVYDKVVYELNKKYNCYIPDCFDHPEYLKAVLKELYGESHNEIINSIQKEPNEFAYKKRIEEFVEVLLR